MDATLDMMVQLLKATAEPTRLRIVAILDVCELSVTELCRVLGQSQPRVSRHLKLLCDAEVLERYAEGTSAFHRTTREPSTREFIEALLARLNPADTVIAKDRSRLETIRNERATDAAQYFETVAADWDRIRDQYVSDRDVEHALLTAVGVTQVEGLLDIGTGTGRILELFADRIRSGLGIDSSREMLRVARSRLDAGHLSHCAVRQGDVYDLDVPASSVDVAVLHHVLHFLDDPAAALAEAARTLRPGGRLLVVDFAPHSLDHLRADHAHRRLGFADDEVNNWCERAGLDAASIIHLTPSATTDKPLTVTLWAATQPVTTTTSTFDLEVVS